MNIPYDEMPEKIEELMTEVERLESENKHLLDLQKSMDQQYETMGNAFYEIREYIEKDYSFAKKHDIPLLTKDEQLAGKLFEILDKVTND